MNPIPSVLQNLTSALPSCPSAAAPHVYTPYDTYRFTVPPSRESAEKRADALRRQVLVSAGLGMGAFCSQKRPAVPYEITGKQDAAEYTIENIRLQSMPGFYVTGNLYRPKGRTAPCPGILNPHGHWDHGRLEQSALVDVPARMRNFTLSGMAGFSYDMVGFCDSCQLPHTSPGAAAERLGLTLFGLQLFNSLRCVDFLAALPGIDENRIGCTGASGGATQTLFLTLVDPRIAACAPVNMLSLRMQGGCVCENAPGLHIGASNIDYAAALAPRPMLVTGCTGDWTRDLPKNEFPLLQQTYSLFGAQNQLSLDYCDDGHNYRRSVRETVCRWFIRQFWNRPSDFSEEGLLPVCTNSLSVPLPPDALKGAKLLQALMDQKEAETASFYGERTPQKTTCIRENLTHFFQLNRNARLTTSLPERDGGFLAELTLEQHTGAEITYEIPASILYGKAASAHWAITFTAPTSDDAETLLALLPMWRDGAGILLVRFFLPQHDTTGESAETEYITAYNPTPSACRVQAAVALSNWMAAEFPQASFTFCAQSENALYGHAAAALSHAPLTDRQALAPLSPADHPGLEGIGGAAAFQWLIDSKQSAGNHPSAVIHS